MSIGFGGWGGVFFVGGWEGDVGGVHDGVLVVFLGLGLEAGGGVEGLWQEKSGEELGGCEGD